MDAIYARQSVDKKDSISIEGQIEFCKKEIPKNTNIKTYIDKGYSGKDTNRPNFEAMINDIRNNIISRVIVYKLDRISRSVLDFANMIDMFKKHNVDFVSSTEKFDTSTPIGRAMIQIIMIFAQLERETIQQRISDNYYQRGRKGFFLGGRIPFGFTKTGTTIEDKKTSILIENEEQSIYIKKMYEMYATTNMSLGKISDYLNDKKFPSACNKNWDSSKISKILKNPVYVKADADVYLYYKNNGAIISNELSDFTGEFGCYLFGKRKPNERKFTNVENHTLAISPHKGIIDSKTWLRCQYKLDTNKQIKNSGKGKYSWLSGIAKCGYCNYTVSVFTYKEYKYFRCRGKSNYKTCNGHSKTIRVEEIEDIVKTQILNKIKNHKIENQVKEIKYEDNNTNKLKMRLIEIESQIENMINQIAKGNDVVIKYINQKINKLDDEKSMLIDKIKKNSINKNVIDYEKIIEVIKNWDSLSIEEKKGICQKYIDKVLIKDDSIDIKWRLVL